MDVTNPSEPNTRGIGQGWVRATIVVWAFLMLAAVALVPADQGPIAFSLMLMPWSGLVLSSPLVAFLRFATRTPAPEVSSALLRRVRTSIAANLATAVIAIALFAVISPGDALAAFVLTAGCWTPAVMASFVVRRVSPRGIDPGLSSVQITAATVCGAVGVLLSIPLLGSHLASYKTARSGPLKEDLRSLTVAEDAFFADSIYYAPLARLSFRVRPGNSIRVELATDHLSWGAVVKTEHQSTQCAAWDGTVFPTQIFPSALAIANRPDKGVPLCWDEK